MIAISKQALCIGAICLADLITTIWWSDKIGATEANPFMAGFLSQGVAVFVIAKLVLTVGPLCLLEWARVKRPIFVKHAMNFGAVAYLGLYVAGIAHLNNGPIDTDVKKMVVHAPKAVDEWIKNGEHLGAKKQILKFNVDVLPSFPSAVNTNTDQHNVASVGMAQS